MRVKVNLEYVAASATPTARLILAEPFPFTRARPAGAVLMEIAPGSIVEPGSSLGGWIARRVRYAGEDRLSLVRVTGPEKARYRKSGVLPRDFHARRGEVLKPGPGLWAVSAASARRGLMHPVPVPRTRLERAITALRFNPRGRIIRVTPEELARMPVDIAEEDWVGDGFMINISTYRAMNGTSRRGDVRVYVTGPEAEEAAAERLAAKCADVAEAEQLLRSAE